MAFSARGQRAMDGVLSVVEDSVERARLTRQSLSVAARATLFAGLASAIFWWLPLQP